MAVLIEAISVVVRKDAAVRSFRGGWESFRVIIPNNTFCADTEISRIGFMEPNAARNFIERLEFGGLTFVEDGEAKDLAAVDQQRGSTTGGWNSPVFPWAAAGMPSPAGCGISRGGDKAPIN